MINNFMSLLPVEFQKVICMFYSDCIIRMILCIIPIELFLQFEQISQVILQSNQSWLEKGTKEHFKNDLHFL